MFGRKNKKQGLAPKKEPRLRPVRKHRIKTQVWIDGVLTTREYWLDTLAEAKRFATLRSKKVHLVKIYNQDGELVHQENYLPQKETYA